MEISASQPPASQNVILKDTKVGRRHLQDGPYKTQVRLVSQIEKKYGGKFHKTFSSKLLNGRPIGYLKATYICSLLFEDWDENRWYEWLTTDIDTEARIESTYSPNLQRNLDVLHSVPAATTTVSVTASHEHIPQDLPSPDITPIGRDDDIVKIHDVLQDSGRAIISGMPGVGKSLLALHYAIQKQRDYLGGAFWIDAREGDIALQIVQMAITQGVVVPDTIELSKQLRYCTKHWPLAPKPVLLVFDNVDSEDELSPVLKWLPVERFKLLITSRPQMRLASIERAHISVLPAATAVSIIREILPTDDSRLSGEREPLLELCGERLGGLPLALQIVGQALKENPYLSIVDLNQQLRTVGNPFAGTALTDVDMADMLESVKQGIMAVFELSWQALPADSQLLAGLISLYAPAQVPWSLIQAAAKLINTLENPAAACAKVRQMSLVQRTGKESYKMHRLLRSFFQLKMQGFPNVKEATHQALIEICRKVPERCNQVDAEDFIPIEPHVVAAIGEGMHDSEFYQALQCYFVGRGLYRQAYIWSALMLEQYKQSSDTDAEHLARLNKQVGERAHLSALYEVALDHLDEARDLLKDMPLSKLLAEVLVILSAALRAVSANEEAEAVSQKALELCERFFEPDSLEIAEAKLTQATAKFVRLRDTCPPVSASNFAILENDVHAIIEIRERQNPDDGSSIAEAHNLLAKILEKISKPEVAIAHYRKAVELTKPPHADAASARNNLAKALEGTAASETVINLYRDAITIFADAAQEASQGWCQHNLGIFYDAQGCKKEGIALVKSGLQLLEQSNHPRATICAEHLANMLNDN